MKKNSIENVDREGRNTKMHDVQAILANREDHEEKFNYRLLDLCLRFGVKMLSAGGETSRVEDSVLRILNAYGRIGVSVFAIPTLLLISFQDEEGTIYTSSRRIINRGTDFQKLDALNTLSRALCSGETKTLNYFQNEIESIAKLKPYRRAAVLFAAVIVSTGFSYIFGANGKDIIFAGLTAFFVKFIYELLNDAKLNSTYVILMTSFVSAATLELLAKASAVQNPSAATVAVMMNLVPGMLLTTSMYDIVNKDFTSGLNKLVESMFIALALAIGSGVAVVLLR